MTEALRISGIGIFIVFFALIIISTSISLISKFFDKGLKISKNKNENLLEPENNNLLHKNEVTPELIAVISAAVRVAYGPCTRIHSIGFIHKESQYANRGRMNIMTSHKLK
jgi:Na+-transporting methylmalonyl-CoA/oxaloacetate decarboxylase gamma subunit